MAESFSKHSPVANRINFGMRRIKWLIVMMHWCQDHQRCSEDPDIADFANVDVFKEALQVSTQKALLRKNDSDQVDTISKAADPGKFKDEKKWPDWEPAFVNYLSTIPGVKGIPCPMCYALMKPRTMKPTSRATLWPVRSLVHPSITQHSVPMPEKFISCL